MSEPAPQYLILGKLNREYVITADKKIHIDQPGGNALYAAGGASLWLEEDEPLGIVSRVGEDYPRQWVKEYKKKGYHTEGINILMESVDLRKFRRYSNIDNFTSQDPIGQFAEIEKEFPKALLGYKSPSPTLDSKQELNIQSIRKADLPENYLQANAAHLCPIDYLTHSLIPTILRQEGMATITLDPGPGYFQAEFWDDLPAVFRDITTLTFSEKDVRNVFKNKTDKIWEMIEEIATLGCPLIIVRRGERGQLLYDKDGNKKYEIPAYDARVTDTSGAGSAFCGGYLVGFRHTFDPLQGVLHGNIAASISVEGSGAFYAKDVLPGLQAARLENLKASVREV